jgi:uncharacterized membrane protein YbhN (UPF0104 family)
MKGKLTWFIKLTFTLILFLLIFTEIGEQYIPVRLEDLAPENTGLLLSGGKSMFGLRGSDPHPIPVSEACGLKGGAVKIRTPEGKLARLDTDLHCHPVPGAAATAGAGFQSVFVKTDEGYEAVLLSAVRGRQIYLKTRGWWRVAPITPRDLWAEIKGVDLGQFWFWLGFATVMKTAGVLASLARWMVLLVGQGLRLPFRYLAGTFFIGRFFGMFLPGTLGLDGYRLYDSIRQTRRPIECTAVIAVEKLIGFIALFGWLFITLPMGITVIRSKGLELHWTVLAVILVVFAAFIAFVLLLLFSPSLARTLFRVLPIPFKRRFHDRFDEVLQATTAYSDKRLLLIKAILLGFGVHLGTILMYVGTARAIATEGVTLKDIFFAAPLMITGTVFGPSIGGEGIRELVFTYLLGNLGTAAKAFLLAHLGFWIGEFLLSLPGAVAYALRPAGYKAKLTAEDLEKVKSA